MKTVQFFRTLIFLAGMFSLQLARAQCHAAFTYTVNGATISLTDASTYTASSGSMLYGWTFGDGSEDWSKAPAPHTYQYAGTYNVGLQIHDSLPNSCQDIYWATIQITNAPHLPCAADFYIVTDSLPDSTVTFVNLNSLSYRNVKRFWDFGDGYYDTTASYYTTHQYAYIGKHYACLKTVNDLGDTCTFCDTIYNGPCWQRLIPSFTMSGNNPVSFTSHCKGAYHPRYNWDFGDGSYSWDENPVHSYPYNGSYTVCLTYYDSAYCSRTFCDSLTISNAAPYPCNALFTYAPDTAANAARSVSFFDQSSSGVVAWSWSFPGGSPSSSASWANVTYPSAGTYSVCLTVTNKSGISCTYCDSVIVGNMHCPSTYANFTLYPDSAKPHVWTIYNQSHGAQPMTYSWSWGDGTTSTGVAPSHTYTVAGWYNICLTIVDAQGCGASMCLFDSLHKYDTHGGMIQVTVVDEVTGISENTLSENEVTVYPNPTNGVCTVTNEKLEFKNIEIYNLYGEKVYSLPLNARSGTVDLSSAGSGVYWIKLSAGESTVTKKLVLIK